MRISPLGRVEGDLDLKLEVTDGVVTDAWTEASMFRGFEIILKGKDPRTKLVTLWTRLGLLTCHVTRH